MNQLNEAVFVYGVTAVSALPIPEIEGVDSAPVGTLGHGGLAALVSPINRTELRAADVRAHWRVLERAFEHATVLPARFGTVMETEDEVRHRLLEPNEERLTALLKTMDGLIQLNVKGRYDEESLLRGVLRESRGLARLRERAERSGTMADQVNLGRQVEHEIEQRRARTPKRCEPRWTVSPWRRVTSRSVTPMPSTSRFSSPGIPPTRSARASPA